MRAVSLERRLVSPISLDWLADILISFAFAGTAIIGKTPIYGIRSAFLRTARDK